jgi:hypothetical protein
MEYSKSCAVHWTPQQGPPGTFPYLVGPEDSDNCQTSLPHVQVTPHFFEHSWLTVAGPGIPAQLPGLWGSATPDCPT